MNSKPRLRSPLDRARQQTLCEAGGLTPMTPPSAMLSGVPTRFTAGFAAHFEETSA